MKELSRAAARLATLASADRLAVLTAVASRGAGTLAEVAADTGQSVRTVVKEAVRLAECGLLTIDGQRLTADLAPLRTDADTVESVLPTTRLLAEDPRLARHFRHGRLVAVPDELSLRHRLADLLAQLLPADRELTEHEVNELLGEVYDDHAALRRLLADMGRVTRDGSARYRRVTSGGT
ncbi:MAG: DUF2087 domain-containing protein [Actinocatenispora sp.]